MFCFISFIGIYYPLTDIVIVHIVYINASTQLMSLLMALLVMDALIIVYLPLLQTIKQV